VGQAVRRAVDGVPILVVRGTGGTLHGLAERCSHLAGPLSEGTVADGCVQCPWHGSVFRLSDGWNVRGPATAPQPAFDTRITDGHVEIRLRQQDGAEPTANGRAEGGQTADGRAAEEQAADRHSGAGATGRSHRHGPHRPGD
uniref:Rieske (2Fe-2S) protein n=1 Tax=Streptomyces neyagawaensis TaxID=42238 RepID=UPI000AF6BD29